MLKIKNYLVEKNEILYIKEQELTSGYCNKHTNVYVYFKNGTSIKIEECSLEDIPDLIEKVEE